MNRAYSVRLSRLLVSLSIHLLTYLCLSLHLSTCQLISVCLHLPLSHYHPICLPNLVPSSPICPSYNQPISFCSHKKHPNTDKLSTATTRLPSPLLFVGLPSSPRSPTPAAPAPVLIQTCQISVDSPSVSAIPVPIGFDKP